MLFNLRDYYLPSQFIAILIGYQISIYFLFQYYKVKDDNLELNKILLVYGLVFAFLISAYLIEVINNSYIQDVILTEFVDKILFILIFSGTIIILSILLTTKSFSVIIKPIYNKIFLILNLIPLICVFFLNTNSLEFNLTLIVLVFDSIYLLLFQRRLIKLSTGSISRRLTIILVGGLIGLGAIFFGGPELSYRLFQERNMLVLTLSIPILIAGLFIIFFGLYEFPAFLEFTWRENLLGLYIINIHYLKVLYSYEFSKDFNEKEQSTSTESTDHFISRGITGIENIMSFITDTEDTKIYKIKQGNLIILMRHGEEPFSFLTYALLVKKEMNSLQYFLKSINKQFQDNYKNILQNLELIKGHEKRIFSSFDDDLKKLIK